MSDTLKIEVPMQPNPKPTQEDTKAVLDRIEQLKTHPLRKSIMLPEKFRERADAITQRRRAYNALLNELAKIEIGMNVEMNDMFLKIREHFAANGYPENWVDDMGFDSDALAVGIYVVNINKKQ